MSKNEFQEVANILDNLYEGLDEDFEMLLSIRGKNADIREHFESTNEVEFEKVSQEIEDLLSNVHESIENTLESLSENEEKLRGLEE